MSRLLARLACVAVLSVPALSAHAEIVIGVDVSTTGAAAAIGIQTNNAVRLWPATLGGQPARYVVLDDGTDVSRAVKNMRKLTSEDKVDAIVGPNITAAALAGLDVLAETGTPMIALAASSVIVEPLSDPKRAWAFKMPQNDSLMATAMVQDMKKKGLKNVAFIGFADSYGDSWWKEFSAAAGADLKIVAQERFQRTDASVMGQVLKLIAAKPDAVLIAGAGTPSALPQKELRARNYGGVIYQTHGAANNDVLRVCGKDCDGMFLPAGPLLVAAQLPDSNPVKKSALAYVETYEKAHGAGSTNTFGGHMWDAGQLVVAALPAALKTGAKPGTPEFRVAMRDALESIKDLPASQGVFNMSPTDHAGFDERSRVIVKVEGGKWVYQPGL